MTEGSLSVFTEGQCSINWALRHQSLCSLKKFAAFSFCTVCFFSLLWFNFFLREDAVLSLYHTSRCGMNVPIAFWVPEHHLTRCCWSIRACLILSLWQGRKKTNTNSREVFDASVFRAHVFFIAAQPIRGWWCGGTSSSLRRFKHVCYDLWDCSVSFFTQSQTLKAGFRFFTRLYRLHWLVFNQHVQNGLIQNYALTGNYFIQSKYNVNKLFFSFWIYKNTCK